MVVYFKGSHLLLVTSVLNSCLVKVCMYMYVLSILSLGEETWSCRPCYLWKCMCSLVWMWLYGSICPKYLCKSACAVFCSYLLSSRQRNWFHLSYMSQHFPQPCPGILRCQWSSGVVLVVLWGWVCVQVSVCVRCFIALCLNRNLSVLLTFPQLPHTASTHLLSTESLLAKWVRGEPVSYFCLVLCLWYISGLVRRAGVSENTDMLPLIGEKQSRSLQQFGYVFAGEEGEGGGGLKVSDWMAIDMLYFPSETRLLLLPVFPLLSFCLSCSVFSLLISLSLKLPSVLLCVPLQWVQGALPELHYIKAGMLRSWQPALHCPDVITTLLPWNWSVLALWQLGNPPLSSSYVHQFKNSVFSRLPKQKLFPSDTHSV